MHAQQGWIGVDLDGTLAKYTVWEGADHIGDPIPLMLGRVESWLSAGIDVRIFTARVGPQPNGEDVVARAAIEAWCLKHLGRVLPVTATKDYHCLTIWDDRAVTVEANTGRILTVR